MINVLIFIRSFFNIYFNVFVSFAYFEIISMFLVPVICIVMCSSTIIEHKNKSVAKQLCMLFPI